MKNKIILYKDDGTVVEVIENVHRAVYRSSDDLHMITDEGAESMSGIKVNVIMLPEDVPIKNKVNPSHENKGIEIEEELSEADELKRLKAEVEESMKALKEMQGK